MTKRVLFPALSGLLLAACVLFTPVLAEEEAFEPGYDTFHIHFDKNTTPEDLTDDESFTYWTTGWGAQKKKSDVDYPATADAYILEDDVPVPTRKGYYFAGWQTVPVVTDEDLVHGVSKYQVFFDTKISTLGEGAISVKSPEEQAARDFVQEVNYIKDFEGLTEDGHLTFYARWVEAKEIATEEDLRNIQNDLYGAYVLTEDITLTENWQPIGMYFTNYEYYNISWWTYAFRGTLDGNGHTIRGMKIDTALIENPGYDRDENARWYRDGGDCSGAAALFGAACKATFKNLTLEAPVIDLTGENAFHGDHLYAAALVAFDMGSTLTDVHVTAPVIRVSYDDAEPLFATELFCVVGGLEAGSWATNVSGCSVTDAVIDAAVETVSHHGGEFYVGGMLGECYSAMKNSAVTGSIRASARDLSAEEADHKLVVNIGGMNGANASAQQCTVDVTIDAAVTKEQGYASVNIGGFTGAQRYQQVDRCDVKAAITKDVRISAQEGLENVGALIGRMDVFYATLILKYADEVRCGCTGSTAAVTVNGEALSTLLPDSGYPQIDGVPVNYIATRDFTDKDGNAYAPNILEMEAAYGTYLPVDTLEKSILYIDVQ